MHKLLIVLFLSLSLIAEAEERRINMAERQPPLSTAGLRSLEHACKLVVAINAQDWKAVESAITPGDPLLTLLKRDATTQKDWAGVGAYRGSEMEQSTGKLMHRFAYGAGRTTPHEVRVHYTLRDGGFTLAGVTVLGW